MKKYLNFFYDASTVAFHYTILYSLYSGKGITSKKWTENWDVDSWIWNCQTLQIESTQKYYQVLLGQTGGGKFHKRQIFL